MEGVYLPYGVLDCGVMDDPHTAQVFLWVLVKSTLSFHGGDATGGFVTSRMQASAELGISQQQFRTCLIKLETAGVVASESTKIGTTLRLVEVTRYVNSEAKNNQQETNKKPSEVTGKSEAKKKDANTPAFREWYQLYPKKVAPRVAATAFQNAIKREAANHGGDLQAAFEVLMAGVRDYRAAAERDPEFMLCNPATWLNGEKYHDDRSAWVSSRSVKKVESKVVRGLFNDEE